MQGIQGKQCHREVTDNLITYFTQDELEACPAGQTGGFTNPFRYVPHPLVRLAASRVMKRIEASEVLSEAFSEGKMVGVLVVRSASGTGFLAAFSGNAGGRNFIEGFVPPIYDLLDPSGHFKVREAEISALGKRIEAVENSELLAELREEMASVQQCRDEEIGFMKARMAVSKRKRDERRLNTSDEGQLAELVRESQFEKAELKRIRLGWEEQIAEVRERLEDASAELVSMKTLRASMSDELQKWIFRQFVVHDAIGEDKSIGDIFAAQGTVPPGGTGECAAPKLLEYAYRNGLKPIAMGEFWYGRSPDTAVRTHGHFYPSCTSKCGPLLGFMLRGLDILSEPAAGEKPVVIHEDEHLIAACKPSGMPSVPGLDGKLSLQEWLCARASVFDSVTIHAVHRLDMDTSGVMVFAKTTEAAVNLRRQFEEHSVRKTYMARLSDGPSLAPKGCIRLPLGPDYDERPRQKADISQGKAAMTEYELTCNNPDGTADVLFCPITGRTHQLRVHSAHRLGLGRPILGDLLYGAHSVDRTATASRLCLHALSMTLRHPADDIEMTFRCFVNGFPRMV